MNGLCTGETYDENTTEGYRDVDLSLGIGLGYSFTDRIAFSTSYSWGLLSIIENGGGDNSINNRVASFTLAYQFQK